MADWQETWMGQGEGGCRYKGPAPWNQSGKLVSRLAPHAGVARSPALFCFPHLLVLGALLSKRLPYESWPLPGELTPKGKDLSKRPIAARECGGESSQRRPLGLLLHPRLAIILLTGWHFSCKETHGEVVLLTVCRKVHCPLGIKNINTDCMINPSKFFLKYWTILNL